MGKFLDFMQGKKRGIAAVGGVILTWCMKWEVAPERWLELAATLHGLFTTYAIASAVNKSMKAGKEQDAPEVE